MCLLVLACQRGSERTLLLIAACTALLAGAACSTGPPPRDGAVHGTVYVDAEIKGVEARRVYLPDFKLSLRDQGTNQVTSTATTDVYGRYYFPEQPPGTYTLEWAPQNGWAAGQYGSPIEIQRGLEHPDQIRILVAENNIGIIGQVLLKDGSVPGIVSEYFDLVDTPLVSVRDGAQQVVHPAVRSDYNASFALAIPRNLLQNASVHAEIGTASGSAPPGAPLTAGFAITDVTLNNRAPRVHSARARAQGGTIVLDVASGDSVAGELVTSDPDGDAVVVTWKGPGQGANLVAAGNTANWTLAGQGSRTLYAVASDGGGGYATGRLDLAVDRKSAFFSGRVIDKETGNPIAGAAGEVNTTPLNTDANGHFFVEVPLDDRYLVNIRKDEYAQLSQTFDHGDRGRTWRMVPTWTEPVDPKQEIVLTDRRPTLEEKRGRSARLTVAANSLEFAKQAPAGNLTADFATIDIGDGEAPGDWAARTGTGERGLVSYGVLYVRFYDAAGNDYQLKKDAVAKVEIPLSGMAPGQVPNGAPQKIDVWSYDDGDGYWKPSGKAKLDAATSVYEGTADHLSYVNMDQPGAVSCLRVVVDPFFFDKYIRVKDVANDGLDYDTVKEVKLDRILNSIRRIPVNQKIQVEMIEAPGAAAISNVRIEEFDDGNAGAGWVLLPPANQVTAGPQVAELWPPYPYDPCPKAITVKYVDITRSQAFLANKGIILQAEADAYYDQVNASNDRDTLEDWWSENGFDADGGKDNLAAGEKYGRTSFTNYNDLGSGRDMHLYQRADGTAVAWVANYGKFDQNHGNADLAASQKNPGATVCMEFRPLENAAGAPLNKTSGQPLANPSAQTIRQNSVVKFFVYADLDNQPGAELQSAADLDGYGPKRIPNLCMNCHGGTVSNNDFQNPEDADIDAFFRELDYNTYKLPGGREPSQINAPERAAFKTQNQIARLGNADRISTAPIKEVIDVWYRDGAADNVQDDCVTAGNTFADASIPAGWVVAGANKDAKKNFYCNVVGRSCRTCHLAHENFTFATYDQMKPLATTVKNYVTATPAARTMPHTIITYRNFWLSGNPHRPTEVENFAFP